MSSIDQEIKDAIARSLPAQVGDVLRKRLEQADSDATKVAVQAEELKRAAQRISDQALQLSDAGAKLAQHEALAEREAKVTKREQAIELELAKARADNAEKGRTDLFALVGLVFKNPTVTESVFGSVPVKDPTGYSSSQPFNETKTRTVEK